MELKSNINMEVNEVVFRLIYLSLYVAKSIVTSVIVSYHASVSCGACLMATLFYSPPSYLIIPYPSCGK